MRKTNVAKIKMKTNKINTYALAIIVKVTRALVLSHPVPDNLRDSNVYSTTNCRVQERCIQNAHGNIN